VTNLRPEFSLEGMCNRLAIVLLPLFLSVLTHRAFGFNGHRVTEGPVTLAIAEIPVVHDAQTPFVVRISLTNSSASSLSVRLTGTGFVAPWRAEGV